MLLLMLLLLAAVSTDASAATATDATAAATDAITAADQCLETELFYKPLCPSIGRLVGVQLSFLAVFY